MLPAYEDIAHFLLKEANLPENLEPGDPRIDDPVARQAMARAFSEGLGVARGYVFPLQHVASLAGGGWLSEMWEFRRGHLFLVPGDSPIGFRLPLASLPFLAPTIYPHTVPADPLEVREPLPDPDEMAQGYRREGGSGIIPAAERARRVAQDYIAGARQAGPFYVRTALAVEARDGKLCVFLPPLETLEAFLDLVSAIESVAANCRCRCIWKAIRRRSIRAWSDPRGGRSRRAGGELSPLRRLEGLRRGDRAVYEDARLARLGTEKFMIDGRHSGTGGGNHVVVGGITPADSPFLRRPDLLKSLILFWQRHPSLSYLFSGLFIGPTSQHPRIDEARHDSLYSWRSRCRNSRCPARIFRRRRGWWTGCCATSSWM